jgi:hypothetical protein
MIIDFWPKAAEHHVTIFWITAGVFVLSMIPVTWIIGRSILEGLGWL